MNTTVTTAESRAIWDAHHEATEAAMKLARKIQTPEEGAARRAYLKAEQTFYRAWQAVDRKTDAVPVPDPVDPVAESLDREQVEVAGHGD